MSCITCGADYSILRLQCGHCGRTEGFCQNCLSRGKDRESWLWAGGERIHDQLYVLRHKVCPDVRWTVKKAKKKAKKWRV